MSTDAKIVIIKSSRNSEILDSSKLTEAISRSHTAIELFAGTNRLLNAYKHLIEKTSRLISAFKKLYKQSIIKLIEIFKDFLADLKYRRKEQKPPCLMHAILMARALIIYTKHMIVVFWGYSHSILKTYMLRPQDRGAADLSKMWNSMKLSNSTF